MCDNLATWDKWWFAITQEINRMISENENVVLSDNERDAIDDAVGEIAGIITNAIKRSKND